MIARPRTFLLDENMPRKILTSFPRDTTVNELASAVLEAVTQLAHLDISNRVYRLDPSGLEEEL